MDKVAVLKVIELLEATAMTPEEWERGDSMICEFARNGQMI
jgi:hypothetical protein